MAAAHERLPHLQLDHHMVSHPDAYSEGWEWVDALPEACLPPNEEGEYYPGYNLPTVIHYCQSYRVGEYFFTKRRVPHDIFDCGHPIFVDLPRTLAQSEYFINKNAQVRCCSFFLLFSFFLLLTFQIVFLTERKSEKC
jgi:hypothetical protein